MPQDGIAECPICGEEFHAPVDVPNRNEKALDMLEEHIANSCDWKCSHGEPCHQAAPMPHCGEHWTHYDSGRCSQPKQVSDFFCSICDERLEQCHRCEMLYCGDCSPHDVDLCADVDSSYGESFRENG